MKKLRIKNTLEQYKRGEGMFRELEIDPSSIKYLEKGSIPVYGSKGQIKSVDPEFKIYLHNGSVLTLANYETLKEVKEDLEKDLVRLRSVPHETYCTRKGKSYNTSTTEYGVVL